MIKLGYYIFKKRLFFLSLKKILKKFEKNTYVKSKEWAENQAKLTTEDFCRNIDKKLYEEVILDVKKIKNNSINKFLSVKHILGKPGNYLLIYFLVRKFKPEIVAETGVAAGWSSLAILKAFQKNKVGKLLSSDLPYFKKSFLQNVQNPEKYIGILAREEINFKDWTLDIRGDDIALKYFSDMLDDNSIDIFHYDSDKSYSGRVNALKVLKKKLKNEAIIIFDDIQNNLHFCNYVESHYVKFTVIKYDQKNMLV